METHIPWIWSEQHKKFYKDSIYGLRIWVELSQPEDCGVAPWPNSTWAFSGAYCRWYHYERASDGTILETLWQNPGPPKETEANMNSMTCSEWRLSPQYNSYYKLMYGADGIILKTIWEPTSTKEAEMLINSARKAVHFAYRHDDYATTTSHYIPIQ